LEVDRNGKREGRCTRMREIAEDKEARLFVGGKQNWSGLVKIQGFKIKIIF